MKYALVLIALMLAGCGEESPGVPAGESERTATENLPALLVDQTPIVPAGDKALCAFKIDHACDVLATVENTAYTGAGFDVFLMPFDQWEAFAGAGGAETLPAWRGAQVVEYRQRHRLAPGEYGLVVVASRNTPNPMHLRIRVVSNPG